MIESHWQKVTPVAALLYPVSLLFRLAVGVRRALYRLGLLKSIRLPVPVIVVGNVNVGGTGKTPLVAWMVARLARQGRRPGIVSRGYGGSGAVQRATRESDPAIVGDEPVMLAQHLDAPIWVARDRVAAANALLAAHPECDVIVCDDGLQHYRLARDLEVVVIDGERGLGNGWMLPAGPLREPPARLATVDAVVINGTDSTPAVPRARAVFSMALKGRTFRNLLHPERRVVPAYFGARTVHAIAGIGNPGRFFAHLLELGLNVTAHPFPDHHAYTAADTAAFRDEEVIMTEKDAVKCRRFATERWWALAVDAEIDPAFGGLVLRGIAGSS